MKFINLLRQAQFHGGIRLAERHFRWVWILAMLCLFGSAVTVVMVTVKRFLDNPTFMVRFETVANTIPFPSVIVCPEILFGEDSIDRFLALVEIPPDLNVTYLNGVMFMLAAFYAPDVVYKTHDLENIERLLEYNNMTVDTAARLLTTSCENTLIRCRWNGILMNCSDIFHMQITGDGYCCVFNGRSLIEELKKDEHHHHHRHHHNHHFYRKWNTSHFGFQSGLLLAVNQTQPLLDVDLSYKWIALQSNRHYVETSINGTPINPGAEQWAEYHIKNFHIADEARSLSSELRKCRMAHEPLNYFPVYHKKYCVVECEIAHTLRRCNCVRLVHPQHRMGAPICKAHNLLCAQQAMMSYDSDECACLNACDVAVATNYVTMSHFELLSSVKPTDSFYDGLDFKKVSIVRAFIKNKKIKTHSRRSFFKSFDLFAQLGGVFNVFFGCSILSLLELSILLLRGLTAMWTRKVVDEKRQLNLTKKQIAKKKEKSKRKSTNK